jgi:hypothetical protein
MRDLLKVFVERVDDERADRHLRKGLPVEDNDRRILLDRDRAQILDCALIGEGREAPREGKGEGEVEGETLHA